MKNLKEVKEHFSKEGIQSITNEAANYQFVKRNENTFFQFSDGEYKKYRTFEGFCKAALYRIKRG